MMARRWILNSLLLACLTVGLAVWEFAWWCQQEGENYTRIEPRLYMGGDVKRPPPGTRAVLNLCEKDDPYRTEIYRWEPIPDRDPAPGLDWLRQMVGFIDSQQRAGRTTYVHCRNGVSRSALVVVAYEMFKNHWSRDEALAFVRSRRPEARPNSAFMQRLLEWEAVLDGRTPEAACPPAGGR
jgi:hypothetical protein